MSNSIEIFENFTTCSYWEAWLGSVDVNVGVKTMTKENVRSNACVSQNEYSIDNILPIHLGFYNLKSPLDYLRINSRKPQFNKILDYSIEI